MIEATVAKTKVQLKKVNHAIANLHSRWKIGINERNRGTNLEILDESPPMLAGYLRQKYRMGMPSRRVRYI
jgi:hypothetical protein